MRFWFPLLNRTGERSLKTWSVLSILMLEVFVLARVNARGFFQHSDEAQYSWVGGVLL
jgi:hypothetical protein